MDRSLPMKTIRIVLVILILVLFAVPFVSASVIVPRTVYLGYNDGTSVALAAGTYTSVYRHNNVWYVNGLIYPSTGGYSSGSTPAPTPEITVIPFASPTPTPAPASTPLSLQTWILNNFVLTFGLVAIVLVALVYLSVFTRRR